MTCKRAHDFHPLSIFALFVAALLAPLGFSPTAWAQNPVPLISQPLVPEAAAPGGTGFRLTVNGTGFVPDSVVHWNGAARATLFVDQGRLTATIPATDIAKAGTASVAVVNPEPGGGTSGTVFFPIHAPTPSVSLSRIDFSPTGVGNFYVVRADFKGEGKLDLAVTEFISGQVKFLLGRGDGTFQFFQTYPACSAHGLASGDFNGDGILDLAVADAGCGQVSILLGNGDGTFTEGGSFSTGGGATFAPYSVAVGDFNSDGKLDLATADEGLNKVSVLLGNGDGTFQSHVDYDTGADSRQVATGDFNGDGRLDLAVSSSEGVSILLGNGDGTFGAHVNYPAAAGARGLVAADFNGDGRLDLAVANQFVDSISVFLQPVLDTTPPTITVGVNPKMLWPPNGKMVPVTVSGTITDTGSGVNVTRAAYSVTDEYGEVQPAGAITLGAGGSYSFTVLLQASRLGTDLDGRHYTITVRASDNSGNIGSQASGVTVPHDQRD